MTCGHKFHKDCLVRWWPRRDLTRVETQMQEISMRSPRRKQTRRIHLICDCVFHVACTEVTGPRRLGVLDYYELGNIQVECKYVDIVTVDN
ncbi:hypothetical protein AVEN_251745-1 [Araneus ventricosus]|uniref:Uncharacterized protein n=1 Tax=Araneus ventricosus TaxID=182803 RepID=A0A4Y2T478_ARAVE|nr:hypothetical protein AVEN_251745-1 [Araneus ventricosus]